MTVEKCRVTCSLERLASLVAVYAGGGRRKAACQESDLCLHSALPCSRSRTRMSISKACVFVCLSGSAEARGRGPGELSGLHQSFARIQRLEGLHAVFAQVPLTSSKTFSPTAQFGLCVNLMRRAVFLLVKGGQPGGEVNLGAAPKLGINGGWPTCPRSFHKTSLSLSKRLLHPHPGSAQAAGGEAIRVHDFFEKLGSNFRPATVPSSLALPSQLPRSIMLLLDRRCGADICSQGIS